MKIAITIEGIGSTGLQENWGGGEGGGGNMQKDLT